MTTKISKINRKTWQNKKYKERMREVHRKLWQNPDYRRKMIIAIKKRKFTKKWRMNIGLAQKNKKVSKITKMKISKALLNHSMSKETRKKISIASKRMWKNTKHRKRMHKILSENSKRMWSNKRFKEKNLKKWFKSQYKRPNKIETKLKILLKQNYPNEWKYVGNGQIWIDGRNPDFINVNGKKAVIDVFGDYYHNKEKFPNLMTDRQRKNHFKKYGYDSLIIWEHEIKKEPERVIEKVENTFYGGN